MNRRRPVPVPMALAVTLALGGCRTPVPAGTSVTVEAPPPQREWERLVSEADLARLQSLDGRWTTALSAARRAGGARRIAAEGALVDPAAALPRPELPPGPFRCRIVSFGPPDSPRTRAVTSQAPLFCAVGVSDNRIWFARQTGTGGRPGGYVYPDTDSRAIFIGATAQGRETVPPPYTDGSNRNVIGRVERIGPFRYRLILPDGAARVAIYEMVPAATP